MTIEVILILIYVRLYPFSFLEYHLLFILVQSFTYQCSEGYCGPTYGYSIKGSSEDVAKACSNDHPKCKAYQYSAHYGRGVLCASANNEGKNSSPLTRQRNKNCVKNQGCIQFRFLVIQSIYI